MITHPNESPINQELRELTGEWTRVNNECHVFCGGDISSVEHQQAFQLLSAQRNEAARRIIQLLTRN